MNGPFLKITWSKLKLEECLYQLTSGDLLITKPNEALIWINQNEVETALYDQIVVRFNKEAIESEKPVIRNFEIKIQPAGVTIVDLYLD